MPEGYIISLTGTGLHKAVDGYASDWSPTGNNLVFNRDDPDVNGVPDADSDVWMAHTDGSGLTRITNTPSNIESFPTWSPDGTASILFGRIVAAGVYNIFSHDLTTGDEQLLLADFPPIAYSVAYPSWQPLVRQ